MLTSSMSCCGYNPWSYRKICFCASASVSSLCFKVCNILDFTLFSSKSLQINDLQYVYLEENPIKMLDGNIHGLFYVSWLNCEVDKDGVIGDSLNFLNYCFFMRSFEANCERKINLVAEGINCFFKLREELICSRPNQRWRNCVLNRTRMCDV